MVYVGLACGIVYAFGGLVYDLMTIGLNPGTALAFLALVGMPLMFGAAGYVAGALYDVTASAVGGLRGRGQ